MTTHPDYDAFLPAWLRARDVLAGEDAVKSAAEKYLPRLQDQTDPEYHAYRSRAAFFNATARTADGYLGLLFRRPPFYCDSRKMLKYGSRLFTQFEGGIY